MSMREQRRIEGPEKSFPYRYLQDGASKESIAKRVKADDQSLTRMDGRSPLELQKVFIAVDVISQAKGSCFLEIGKTKVICGVFGPREVQRKADFKLTGQVCCEVQFAPFSCKERVHPQIAGHKKELSVQIKQALETVIILEKYPKAQLDVFVTVVEDGGSVASSCVTAAGVAVAHAGVHLYDTVVAVDLAWLCGVCLLNPSLAEEEAVRECRLLGTDDGTYGTLVLGVMPRFSKGQVALMVHEGEVAHHELADAVNVALDACGRVGAIARQTLSKHVQRILSQQCEEGEEEALPPQT